MSFVVHNMTNSIPELVVEEANVDLLTANTLNAEDVTVEELDARTSIYNGMRTVTVIGYTPTSFVGTAPGVAIPLNSRPGRPLATSPDSPDLVQLPGFVAEGGGPGVVGDPVPYQPMSIMITSNGSELTSGVGIQLTVGLCSAINIPPSSAGQVVLLNSTTRSQNNPFYGVEAGIVAEGGYPPVPAVPFGPTDLGSSGSIVGNPFLPGDPISWVPGGNLFLVLESTGTIDQGELSVYFTFRVPAYPPFVV